MNEMNICSDITSSVPYHSSYVKMVSALGLKLIEEGLPNKTRL